jgi:hypothetical protein
MAAPRVPTLLSRGRWLGAPMKRPEQEIQKALADQDEMRAAGAEIGVAVGIDAALAQLEDWGLLRGRSQ